MAWGDTRGSRERGQGRISPATTDEPVTNIWWGGAGTWDVLLGHLVCLAADWE